MNNLVTFYVPACIVAMHPHVWLTSISVKCPCAEFYIWVQFKRDCWNVEGVSGRGNADNVRMIRLKCGISISNSSCLLKAIAAAPLENSLRWDRKFSTGKKGYNSWGVPYSRKAWGCQFNISNWIWVVFMPRSTVAEHLYLLLFLAACQSKLFLFCQHIFTAM